MKAPLRAVLGCTFCLGLTSCTLIPEHTRPDPPVAARWPGGVPEIHAPTTRHAAQITWTEFFPSPRLQEAVRTALENNRDLRIAALRIEQARAIYRIERADLLPSIGINANATRQEVPEAVSAEGRAGQQSIYNANLGITAFELDLFGRLQSETRAAVEEFLATAEGHRAATVSLIAATANAYLQWLADRKLLALTEDTLAAQEHSYRLVERSFQNGIASKLDLAQVRQAVERARADRALFARRVEQDKNALVLLMGSHDEQLLSPTIGLDDIRLLEQLPIGLPSEVLLLRPDVQAAERSLRAENARIGAARAAFLPRLSLTGTYGYASSELSQLFSGGAAGAWTFVPQLTLPLFEGGRNLANLELAEARKSIAVADYELRLQTAFREVADELAARRTLGLQLQAQQDLVTATRDAYDLSLARYRAGIESFLAVLDAQRSLLDAQQEQIDIQRQLLANLVNLYKALGGGAAGEGAA